MPRRPNSGDLINIDNLEKSRTLVGEIVDLMQKLNNTSDVKGWTSNLEKFQTKYIELLTLTGRSNRALEGTYNTIQKDLESQIDGISRAIDLTYDYIDAQAAEKVAIDQKIEARKQENRLKKESEDLTKRLRRETSNIPSGQSSTNWTDALKNWKQRKEKENIENYNNKLIEDIQNKVLAKHGNKVTEDNYDAIKKEIDEKIGKANFKDFSTTTKLFGVAVDTLKKGADVLLTMATKGMTNQTNAYETTFSNIAVRNNMTRSNYYGAQRSTNNILSNNGLYNNIKTSDLQNTWNTLASQGIAIDFSSAEAQTKTITNSIETALTNKIVPYLDTTDAYYQQLMVQQPTFNKQIRGIDMATKQIEGSSVVVTKHLQDIINNVSPIATLANQELGMQYAKATGIYEDLRNQGMSDYEIQQYMGSTYQIYTNPLQALKSGNIDQQLAVVGMYSDNVDMDDYGVNTEYLLKSSNWLSNLVPEMPNGQSKILSGTLPSSVDNVTRHRANMMNYNIDQAVANGQKIADSLNHFSELATNNYKNDTYQTNRTLQDTTLENFMNELATVNQWMGNWTDVITTAINGIGAILVTYLGGKLVASLNGSVIGKGVGALAGSANGGTGVGLLASGGGLSLGAFAGAASIALSGFIADGILQSETKNMGKNANYYEQTGELQKYQRYDAQGKPIQMSQGAKDLLSAGLDNKGSKGWGKNIGLGFNFVNSYKTNDWMAWGVSLEDRNQAAWEQYSAKVGASNLEPNEAAKYLLAWLMIADTMNVISHINDWSHDKIKEAYGTIFSSDEDALNYVEKVRKSSVFAGAHPKFSTDGDKQSSYSYPTNMNNYHRGGLSYVPYDDYPAYLHEGEAVLTANTASELRALIDEYRATSQQAASFDVIIQNQTLILGAKLDAILQTLKVTGTGGGTPIEKVLRLNKVNNSMTTMRSTTMLQ